MTVRDYYFPSAEPLTRAAFAAALAAEARLWRTAVERGNLGIPG